MGGLGNCMENCVDFFVLGGFSFCVWDWIFVSYDLFLTAGHCPGKKFVKFLTLPPYMHNYSFYSYPVHIYALCILYKKYNKFSVILTKKFLKFFSFFY